jgi:hypothetical protein
MLLAIDPGIRGVGAALFDDKELQAAAYVMNNPHERGDGPFACVEMARAVNVWLGRVIVNLHLCNLSDVVIEWPQVYTQGKLKGDPNDLLPLVGVGVAICALAPNAFYHAYKPREWKGQAPKEVTHNRAKGALSVPEFRILFDAEKAAGSKAHNLIDAVALGLFHLGRLNPKRVFPR